MKKQEIVTIANELMSCPSKKTEGYTVEYFGRT